MANIYVDSMELKNGDVAKFMPSAAPTQNSLGGFSYNEKTKLDGISTNADVTKAVMTSTTDAAWTVAEQRAACARIGAAHSEQFEYIEKFVMGYGLTESEPANWATNYTDYFTRSGEAKFPVYTAVPAGESAPTWTANTYYEKAVVDGNYNITSVDFSESVGGVLSSFSEILIFISTPKAAASSNIDVSVYSDNFVTLMDKTTCVAYGTDDPKSGEGIFTRHVMMRLYNDHGMLSNYHSEGNRGVGNANPSTLYTRIHNVLCPFSAIKGIRFYASGAVKLIPDTEIKVYGVRA